MSLVALQLAHVLQCLKNVWQICTNMACEHKGVAMAHDVTKQVTIEKTNVNGAVAATITANGKVETQVLKD
jgi:hypothetical protein